MAVALLAITQLGILAAVCLGLVGSWAVGLVACSCKRVLIILRDQILSSCWLSQAYLVGKEWSSEVIAGASQTLADDLPLPHDVPGTFTRSPKLSSAIASERWGLMTSNPYRDTKTKAKSMQGAIDEGTARENYALCT